MKRAMTFHFVWCLTSGLDGRALSRALEPAGEVPEFGIERLADLAAEIDEAIEQDIGEREALADDEFLPRHLAVEPFDAILRDLLETVGGFGNRDDAVLEELQALAEAEAVRHRLADVEIDAPGPHPRLGFLFRVRADERGLRVLVLEIFADHRDLGDELAAVELQRRHLAVRVALQMLAFAVLALHQVHFLRRQ